MDEGVQVRLRGCPLFEHASDSSVRHAARHARWRRFRRGEVIFHRGDAGDVLHVISSGSVKVAVDSDNGGEAILATLGPGMSFGELSVIDGSPRSATVRAVGASETITLDRTTMRDLMAGDDNVRDALMAEAMRVIRRLTDQVAELHFLDLGSRLAMRIARMAREADPSADRVSLEWPLRQAEVAAMVGGTRQSVNRVLNDMVDAGLIRIGPDRLVVLDVSGLLRRGSERRPTAARAGRTVARP
jgi:CRP-like cAMP-binding protein